MLLLLYSSAAAAAAATGVLLAVLTHSIAAVNVTSRTSYVHTWYIYEYKQPTYRY